MVILGMVMPISASEQRAANWAKCLVGAGGQEMGGWPNWVEIMEKQQRLKITNQGVT